MEAPVLLGGVGAVGAALVKQVTLALALLLGLAATVRAEDAPSSPPAAPPVPAAPSPSKPTPPPTPEQAADAVLAAIAAKDDTALKTLASKDAPDPWLVADELIRREQHDAAEAFARAAPRAATEALPAYVTSRRGKSDDPARRARLEKAVTALDRRRLAEALDAAGPDDAGGDPDLVALRLWTTRARALAGLSRFAPSASEFLGAAAACERLGWLRGLERALDGAAAGAWMQHDLEAARDAWTRRLAVCERLGDRSAAAVASARQVGPLRWVKP